MSGISASGKLWSPGHFGPVLLGGAEQEVPLLQTAVGSELFRAMAWPRAVRGFLWFWKLWPSAYTWLLSSVPPQLLLLSRKRTPR